MEQRSGIGEMRRDWTEQKIYKIDFGTGQDNAELYTGRDKDERTEIGSYEKDDQV